MEVLYSASCLLFWALSRCWLGSTTSSGLSDRYIIELTQGFVNFAVYEPEAMDVRSRPIRIFKDGTIEFYNYSEALAHEVMHSHNIPRLRNEIILYAKKTPYGSRNRYYIISNYRFIYCTVLHSNYSGHLPQGSRQVLLCQQTNLGRSGAHHRPGRSRANKLLPIHPQKTSLQV